MTTKISASLYRVARLFQALLVLQFQHRVEDVGRRSATTTTHRARTTAKRTSQWTGGRHLRAWYVVTSVNRQCRRREAVGRTLYWNHSDADHSWPRGPLWWTITRRSRIRIRGGLTRGC